MNELKRAATRWGCRGPAPLLGQLCSTAGWTTPQVLGLSGRL